MFGFDVFYHDENKNTFYEYSIATPPCFEQELITQSKL